MKTPEAGTTETADVARLNARIEELKGEVTRLRAENAAQARRLNDFASTMNGWFWETDVENRFTYFSPSVEAFAGAPAEWHYGKTREELGAPLSVTEADWSRHLELLARREPFEGFLFKRVGPNGENWLRTSGRPFYDEAGNFAGYRGSAVEVSAEIEAKRRSELDSLTGIANRRHVLDRVAAELGRSLRYERALSICMIDIDCFKATNDAYGHAAGDAALLHAVEAIRPQLRESDCVGRVGGDEFLVVLPESDLDGALVIAGRLRAAIAATPVRSGDAVFDITASIGVAEREPGCTSGKALIADADAALYRAKRAGRNCVVGGAPARRKTVRGVV